MAISKPKPVETVLPDFIQAINDDYKSEVAHVFILHGNVYDSCDNSGKDLTVKQVFTAAYDDNFQKNASDAAVQDKQASGIQEMGGPQKATRILVTYNLSQGMDYPHPKSFDMMRQAFTAKVGSEKATDSFMRPKSPQKLIEFMNLWFEISKERKRNNTIAKKSGLAREEELLVTWLLLDADALFPAGDLGQLGPDRMPIVSVRQWAQDSWLAATNRIVLMTRYVSDVHASIRSEISAIHLMRKPNMVDRLQYIKGFDATIKFRAAANGGALTVGKNDNVNKIDWADDFGPEQCAVQSAGMNRKQLKDVFLKSWRTVKPVSFESVRERKQRALEDEYQGMIDFKEPEFGFEEIGGHDHFKEYAKRRIIIPLKSGDARTCSKGALLTGPPGTGKSMLAWALALEAKMNFLIVDLGKVFGGLVGETEANMRKLLEAIEASAPCIVFIDELDSVLSSGRQSSGDSGASARVFNSFMTFLSDPSRAGRIVVLAASNRPDMLDSALIRSGRFDLKVPILPPAKEDTKGRKQILQALMTKHKVMFASDLEPTLKDSTQGLGRLIRDKERIWTGAEIEVVMKEAISSASSAERIAEDGGKDYSIHLDDWNYAMDVVLPNTNEVEYQTLLALLYVDHLGYCPADWRELAKDKDRLRERLGLSQQMKAAA